MCIGFRKSVQLGDFGLYSIHQFEPGICCNDLHVGVVTRKVRLNLGNGWCNDLSTWLRVHIYVGLLRLLWLLECKL